MHEHLRMMLSLSLKEDTRTSHQQLEKQVVQRLKAITTQADYADFLKHFYAYFHAVEQAIAPYITPQVLPDYEERRHASFLKADLETLGSTSDSLPAATAPTIDTTVQALGALYVMEGSIMGGSVIVKMLEKVGITEGVSFFSGYGSATGSMWKTFTEVLNAQAPTEADKAQAVATANETFTRFGDVFAGSRVTQ